MVQHFTCPYSHLLHSGRCGCRYQTKDCVAEKELSACLNEVASQNCIELYQAVRAQADFALDSHGQNALSIGQQNKIKMGGMLALQKIILGEDKQTIADISALNVRIKKRYGDFKQLPFEQLIPSIYRFKFRKPRLLKKPANNLT